MASSLYMHWKKWRLSKIGNANQKEAEVFTATELTRTIVIALMLAAILTIFFSFLPTLR